MSKRILVGKRSDGYQILQAFQPLFDMGWRLDIEKGDNENLKASLFDHKSRPKNSAQGSSLSVALRRLSVGMSKQFSHMME